MKTCSIIVMVFCLCFSLSIKAVETPEQRLMQAAFQDNLTTVRHCIEQDNVDVNSKYFAGYYYDYGLFDRQLENIEKNEQNGLTALQYAAQGGSIAVVKYLLTVPGIDIDCGPNGWGALHRAIAYDKFDIVYLLLRVGADYTKVTGAYETARDIAVRRGGEQRQRIVQFIDNIDRYKPRLFAALKTHNEQKVRLLLQKVPYALKDWQGNTLLHKAVQYCSPELIGLILKLNTQAITEYNKQGQTPVNVAVAHNRWQVLELFTKLAHAQPTPVDYSEDPCTVPVACEIL